ncbi:MAG: GGDEF domain-containing protein [Spirochaetales bacterium]|nr:GGDEF domain-containing protein [Spirochaetales bacterium]
MKEDNIRQKSIERDIRYTLFRMSLLGMCLISLVILLSYLITKRPLVNTITMVTIILLCLIMYRFSCNPDRYAFSRISLYVLFTFIYVPFGFFTSPGSNSSMPYYILFIIFLETFLAVNPWEYLFPLSVMIIQIVLLRLELALPGSFEPFESAEQRMIDLSINYTIAALFIVGIIVFVMRKYDEYSTNLHRVSVTDKLTGLYNRLYLEEWGEAEMSRSLRTGEPLTVIFIDLNNFKRINDTFGHHEGDRVLKDIGGIIRRCSRNYDVCARIGGDEFIILLPATSREAAQAQVSRLDGAFAEYSHKYREQRFSASFGLADSREEKAFSSLLKKADQRLYIDKEERKGTPAR